jgi:hypothetical protein
MAMMITITHSDTSCMRGGLKMVILDATFVKRTEPSTATLFSCLSVRVQLTTNPSQVRWLSFDFFLLGGDDQNIDRSEFSVTTFK